MVVLAPSRMERPPSASRSCTWAAASSSACARGHSTRPFSFSTSRRPQRSNSGWPSARSSLASAWLAADWVSATTSAARLTLPCRAIATNTSSSRRL